MTNLIELKELKYKYCYHLDAVEPSDFNELFVDDPDIKLPHWGDGIEFKDSNNFINWVDSHEFDFMAHMVSNPIIEIDGDTATGQWYYIVVLVDGDDIRWGQGSYDDVYRVLEGDWKIESLVAERNHTVKIL